MITTKQRAFLKGKSSKDPCVAQVGKDGLTKPVLDGIEGVINARELVKINVLKNCDLSSSEVAETLSNRLTADIVSVTGNKIVMYRKSAKNKYEL